MRLRQAEVAGAAMTERKRTVPSVATTARILAELASGPKTAAELAGALVRLENEGRAFHVDGRWHVPTARARGTFDGAMAMLAAVGEDPEATVDAVGRNLR